MQESDDAIMFGPCSVGESRTSPVAQGSPGPYLAVLRGLHSVGQVRYLLGLCHDHYTIFQSVFIFLVGLAVRREVEKMTLEN